LGVGLASSDPLGFFLFGPPGKLGAGVKQKKKTRRSHGGLGVKVTPKRGSWEGGRPKQRNRCRLREKRKKKEGEKEENRDMSESSVGDVGAKGN